MHFKTFTHLWFMAKSVSYVITSIFHDRKIPIRNTYMHLHEQQSQFCDVRLLCFYLAFIKKYKLLPKLNKTPEPTAECQIFIICGVIILARNSRCAQRKHDSRNDKFTAYAMLALLFHTIFTKFTAKSG